MKGALEMLFEQERHEPLTPTIWDESSARATIERIVKDTTDRFTPKKLWPVHPLDIVSGVLLQPFKMLYFGAAGVIWALDYLARVGATETRQDFSSTVAELLEWNRKEVRPFAPEMSSLLMGDVGILLLQWKLAPSESLATQLSDAIEANKMHPAREFMWGAPGTMLARFSYTSGLKNRDGQPCFATVWTSCGRNWNSSRNQSVSCGRRNCTERDRCWWELFTDLRATSFR
jgi:hypothetical protein